MKLKDVMTREVEIVEPDATLKEVSQRMKALDIGVLPVCENDRVIGLITDRDITVRAIAEGRNPSTTKASEIMSQDLICGFEEQDVKEAASIMEERQIRRMPVLDRNQHIVGIVSLGDLAVKTRDEKLAGKTLEGISEPAHPSYGKGP